MTASALAAHERALEAPPARRMFNCARHGVFWRKVPARKPVATCRRCAAAPAGGPAPRLEALPVADECGRGRFECQECGHGWTSNTAHRSLAQYCNECDAVDAQRGTFPLEIRAARPLWLIHKLQKRYLEGKGAAPAQNAGFAGLADIPEDAASEHPLPPRAAPAAAPPPPPRSDAAASGLGDGDYCVVAPAGRAASDEPAGTFYYAPAREGGGGGGGTTYYEPTPAVADTKIVVEPREGDAAAAPPPGRLRQRVVGVSFGRCEWLRQRVVGVSFGRCEWLEGLHHAQTRQHLVHVCRNMSRGSFWSMADDTATTDASEGATFECAICCSPIEAAATGACHHHFCFLCLARWCEAAADEARARAWPGCPKCRAPVTSLRLDPEFDAAVGAARSGALAERSVRLDLSDGAPAGITLEARDRRPGLRVAALADGDAGRRCGLRVGDAIACLDGLPCETPKRAIALVNAATRDRSVVAVSYTHLTLPTKA